MSHCQLHPLLVNPVTGEPYLWLPSPLENIIITPPRMSDAPSMVAILNDPLVCRWILGPPYPYLPSHAESWLESTKKESDAVLQELEQASRETPDGPLKIVGACPVRILREVREDGTEVYLGDIGLRRCVFPHEEPEEQQRLSEKNKRRAVGDPELIWCIGDYLASSHHGRGIMSVAVRILMSAWAIPRMGVRRMRVETARDNAGSARVFQKNGFVLEKTVDEVLVTNYGATINGSHILRWEHK
ncbi:hypothetical protein AcW1_001287 [Taiwanofungus camphoratus]|nr:hypothetical protein AcW2_000188 [Antrodia cinnamomea]KAI0937264.1 hypothetical protein AcV5_005209 [Antrodia cinnamomea]KAI0962472.1 hypothetical protein AcV7_001309 [Antrodia cinnamomea]KAI0964476.1 hypothetical protein AcW1_001287 [Antrodia cinnamomea]